MGVAGGGNDKSPLPAAGVFGAPGERGREREEVTARVGHSPHSLSPPSQPCSLPQRPVREPQNPRTSIIFPDRLTPHSFPSGPKKSFILKATASALSREFHPPSAPSLSIPGQGPISAPSPLVAAKWNVSREISGGAGAPEGTGCPPTPSPAAGLGGGDRGER